MFYFKTLSYVFSYKDSCVAFSERFFLMCLSIQDSFVCIFHTKTLLKYVSFKGLFPLFLTGSFLCFFHLKCFFLCICYFRTLSYVSTIYLCTVRFLCAFQTKTLSYVFLFRDAFFCIVHSETLSCFFLHLKSLSHAFFISRLYLMYFSFRGWIYVSFN